MRVNAARPHPAGSIRYPHPSSTCRTRSGTHGGARGTGYPVTLSEAEGSPARTHTLLRMPDPDPVPTVERGARARLPCHPERSRRVSGADHTLLRHAGPRSGNHGAGHGRGYPVTLSEAEGSPARTHTLLRHAGLDPVTTVGRYPRWGRSTGRLPCHPERSRRVSGADPHPPSTCRTPIRYPRWGAGHGRGYPVTLSEAEGSPARTHTLLRHAGLDPVTTVERGTVERGARARLPCHPERSRRVSGADPHPPSTCRTRSGTHGGARGTGAAPLSP